MVSPEKIFHTDPARPERMIHAEHHEHLHPLRAAMWDALVSVQPEKDYTPDRMRQSVVFDHIDWDTLTSDVFKGTKDPQTDGAAKQIRGKLFEMLIQADPGFGERSALEKELLTLAHSPEKYGLNNELGGYRNPDMAFLLFTGENGTELIGIGESKLGLLNERSFKQLSETGFTSGAHKLIEVVNCLPDPVSHGLVETAKARPIRISADFSQLLVVPANRNIAWSSTLVNRREFTADGRKKFYELLEDTARVRTVNAAFSTVEVGEMAKVLIERVRNNCYDSSVRIGYVR